MGWNTTFFRLINGLAFKNGILDNIMFFFSKYVPYIFMLVIVIIFITGIIKNDSRYRKAAISTIIFTIINLIISFIIGNIIYIDRPFVNNDVNLLYSHKVNASFPSDHATGTMSIALGLGYYNKVVGIILTLISIIVGISRIYVGHHYPIDIIGAYIIVIIMNFIYNRFLKSRIESIYEKVETKIIRNKV